MIQKKSESKLGKQFEGTNYILYNRLGNFDILHDDAIQIYYYPTSEKLGSYVLKRREFQDIISAIVISVWQAASQTPPDEMDTP